MWLREIWDRLVASDPGLSRLRLAVGGALSMVTALGVELVAARLLGAGGKASLLLMMLGGIVAMMGSMVLSGVGPGTWVKVRTAVFFPVAFGVGLTLGTLAHVDTRLTLAVFVVISFAAVFVRRFGIPFFFYGFMAWIGYMISTLLGATPVMLPIMLLALVIGTAWVLLLSLTVLRDNPARTLRRTLRAFHARVRTVAAVCADLAAVDVTDERELRRWQARLHAHQRRLTEAALMIEAVSGQQSLPSARAGNGCATTPWTPSSRWTPWPGPWRRSRRASRHWPPGPPPSPRRSRDGTPRVHVVPSTSCVCASRRAPVWRPRCGGRSTGSPRRWRSSRTWRSGTPTGARRTARSRTRPPTSTPPWS